MAWPKINLLEVGTPCEHCPWPNGPEITARVRRAAQCGSWFACHSRGGGTCFGALAVTKAYYNFKDEKEEDDMTNKSKGKAAKRKAKSQQPFVPMKRDLYADALANVRPGEAPPQYAGISNEEMLRVIKASREQGMRQAVDRANSRLEPKRSVPAPFTPARRPGHVKVNGVWTPQRTEPARPPEPPMILMTEQELEAAMAQARAAQRTDMTMVELLRLLALPYVNTTGAQRGYIRGG